jgi:hypothetical protein
MMIKKLIVLGISLAGTCSTAFCQRENLEKIQQQFNAFTGTHPQEKLFVHTDKEFYLAGEIVWFKVYSDRNNLMSSIAYVDIVDADNKSVSGSKISLKESEDNGSALIPLSVASGNYQLRAYTNWMKNEGDAVFFEKTITIVNPFKNPDTTTQRKLQGYEVKFFPEGGNMVKGLESKVAVKVTDKYGKGINCRGRIVNEKNETVASFRSLKFGMGSFSFSPVEKDYKAIIEPAGGGTITAALPSVYDNGYVMTASDKGTDIEVSLKSTYTGPQYISLFGRLHEALKFSETGIMTNGSFVFTVPKVKLGKGIAQLTVFNAVNQPICERLVFLRPDISVATAAVNNTEYGNRKPVQVEINTKNTTGKPVAADMSVAVFPVDELQPTEQTDIASYYLLTSDLKGYIESPAYYFSNDADAGQAADNLMLTHGWRRYNWDKILGRQNNTLQFAPEYDAHLVRVLVTDRLSKQPLADKEVFLSVPGTRFDFTTSSTNEKGIAAFNLKELYGPSRLVVQVNNMTPGSYSVEVLSPFYGATATAIMPFYLPNQDSVLERYSVNMQVQNIFNADSMRIFYAHELKDTSLFYGKAMYGYNLDTYTRFTTMEEVLREYVREINVAARNGKLYLKILDEGRKEFNDEDLLVLWDGVPVADPNSVFSLDPLKVKRVEVVPRRFAAGGSFFKGIASFTTYNGDLAGYNLPSGTFNSDYEGIQLQREFYSPGYETPSQVNSRMPDFRNTLYWSPNLRTSNTGETKFHFYTGDRKGKYLLVLQGLDENGTPLVTTTTFEVK